MQFRINAKVELAQKVIIWIVMKTTSISWLIFGRMEKKMLIVIAHVC